MRTVWILVLDGLMDSSLAITLDLLRAAQAVESRFKKNGVPSFRFQLIGSRARLTTACGMGVRTELRTDQTGTGEIFPHWIIVPALGEYGTRLEERLVRPDASRAQRLLRSLFDRGCRIASSCASVFLLAEAGLLTDRHATTTWWLEDEFRQRYPSVRLDTHRMVVRDGALLTAGSAFAQLDLMLALIGDLVGTRVADVCASYLLIDRRPAQARYMLSSHLSSRDPAVIAAEQWIDEHLGESITVGALARAISMSDRTLARRVHAAVGMSPVKLIQHRRLMLATHLIQTSSAPIDEVAVQVGYKDSTTLRRLIRRDLGTSPRNLR